MSLMDQNPNHIYWWTQRQKQSKTFYVHDGSTKIIYIGKSITNILCPWWIIRNCKWAKMKQNILCSWWINGIHIYWQTHRQKQNKTFYVHDGSTEIVYVCKNEAKYIMSMMDRQNSYIVTNTKAKTKQNILCPWWIIGNHIYGTKE